MRRLLNILILLGIISLGHYDFSDNLVEKTIVKPPTGNKGPVYNPLRLKPFIKFTSNV